MNESSEIKELCSLLQSRVPIIFIETHEEPRILKLLQQACNLENQLLMRWSIVDGLCNHQGAQRGVQQDSGVYQTNELRDALKHIDKTPQNGVYALLDAHPGLTDPVNVRLIREIALEHYKTARTLVFVSPRLQELPSELLRLAAHFHPALPSRDDIRRIIKEEAELFRSQSGEKARGSRDVIDMLVMHLMGMEQEDVRRLVRQALRPDGELNRDDLRRVLATKHAALGGTGALGFEQSEVTFDAVGGLARMKHWVSLRRAPFLDPVASNDRPKGMLLLGVMGGGKSLAARAIAGEWGVPLMRLDFGAVYNKFYGESERNLRAALSAAEGMSPCVLWIDELEKGIATSSGEQDGGVSRRVLGTFLTWLSERSAASKPVFLVATANDISMLPPELIRKGRFDEIFFVDFPNAAARAQIASIHLKKRGYDPVQFDLQGVVALSEGFSGAEIEQAVVAACFEAKARGATPTATDLAHELKRTRPLSVVMAERIGELRAWAHERAVLADEAGK